MADLERRQGGEHPLEHVLSQCLRLVDAAEAPSEVVLYSRTISAIDRFKAIPIAGPQPLEPPINPLIFQRYVMSSDVLGAIQTAAIDIDPSKTFLDLTHSA
jgi:hypothetical protein